LEKYQETQNIKDVERLCKDLGEEISYSSLKLHLKEHVDLRPDPVRRIEKFEGYCIAWGKQNAKMVRILHNYERIFQAFQDVLEQSLQISIREGRLVKDYPSLARDLRIMVKELREYQEELATNPLVSRDVIYQDWLPKLGKLCPVCIDTLSGLIEDDFHQLSQE